MGQCHKLVPKGLAQQVMPSLKVPRRPESIKISNDVSDDLQVTTLLFVSRFGVAFHQRSNRIAVVPLVGSTSSCCNLCTYPFTAHTKMNEGHRPLWQRSI